MPLDTLRCYVYGKRKPTDGNARKIAKATRGAVPIGAWGQP